MTKNEKACDTKLIDKSLVDILAHKDLSKLLRTDYVPLEIAYKSCLFTGKVSQHFQKASSKVYSLSLNNLKEDYVHV